MEEDGDEEFTVNDETLQRRARHLNNVINHFWKRWNKEYLLELRNAHRYPSTSQQFSSAREGDIVVIQDPNMPRGFWKVARITKLLMGKDGRARGGNTKGIRQRRSSYYITATTAAIVPIGDSMQC